MGKLDGRVAVVTGAGRGIGAEVARTFAAEGASVVVNDLGASMDGSSTEGTPAEEVAEEIKRAGGKAIANNCDVTDFEATEQLIRQAVETFGGLHIVVNVAGIIRDGMIFKMDERQFDSVIAVHLKGSFNTTRHASVYWRENRGGEYRLIYFISGSGLWGAPAQPNYAAAKMGMVGLSNSCASALAGYGVTSNCIAPVAYTRMTASLEGKSTTMNYSPDNEKLSTKNVVPPVVWLASEESSWMNGRIIQCGNGRIGLFNSPAIEREVTTPGVWDLDDAFEEMNTTFRDAVEYPNPFRKPRA
ncbi:MAG TPA: SDR family NAD(P)-dependent oxidoreductase [Myxococcota bacterium]|nr:SDR family NAD(P)-dependent oxidoreductase [Myxococcota bacterium]